MSLGIGILPLACSAVCPGFMGWGQGRGGRRGRRGADLLPGIVRSSFLQKKVRNPGQLTHDRVCS